VALTQMALDSLDFDATVALAEKVSSTRRHSRNRYTMHQAQRYQVAGNSAR